MFIIMHIHVIVDVITPLNDELLTININDMACATP